MRTRQSIVYIGLVFLCVEKYSFACSSTYTADSGTFTSPNYPGFYPPNQQCTFVISPVTPTAKLRLVFDDFDMEKDFDFVNVYDENDDPIGGITGGRYRWIVMPTNAAFRVVFVTNHNRNHIGFTATWSVAPSSASLDYKIATAVGCPITGLYQPIPEKNVIREHEIIVLSSFHDCLLLCHTLPECLYFEYFNSKCYVYEEEAGYTYMFKNLMEKVIGAD